MTKVKNDILTFDQANRLFTYDPFTGELRWSDKEGDLDELGPWSSKRLRGKICSHKLEGARTTYITLLLGKTKMYVHRIAWLLCWEEYPKFDIDHIDGDGQNNRIANLRDVPRRINMRNMRKKKTNSSGHNGVGRWKSGKWFARVTGENRERIYLGTFNSMEDAVAAQKKAAAKHGYHESHGK